MLSEPLWGFMGFRHMTHMVKGIVLRGKELDGTAHGWTEWTLA